MEDWSYTIMTEYTGMEDWADGWRARLGMEEWSDIIMTEYGGLDRWMT